MTNSIAIIAGLAIGYLLGSINWAYIVCKLVKFDLSKVGDGNPGAFNVFRHVGLAAGVAVVIGDVGKGALAIVLARALTGNEAAVLVAGVAAFLGHLWPVFLRFRGGVGLGVTMGVFLALVPLQWLCAAPIGIAVLALTRHSIYFGIASLVSCGLFAFHFHQFHGNPVLIAYYITLSCLVGLTYWLKTRHLPADMRKERATFWIAHNRGL